MSELVKIQNGKELRHYGVKGMHWGVRRSPEELGHPNEGKHIKKSKKSSSNKKRSDHAELRARRDARIKRAKSSSRRKTILGGGMSILGALAVGKASVGAILAQSLTYGSGASAVGSAVAMANLPTALLGFGAAAAGGVMARRAINRLPIEVALAEAEYEHDVKESK